jgi:hypothetical protein
MRAIRSPLVLDAEVPRFRPFGFERDGAGIDVRPDDRTVMPEVDHQQGHPLGDRVLVRRDLKVRLGVDLTHRSGLDLGELLLCHRLAGSGRVERKSSRCDRAVETLASLRSHVSLGGEPMVDDLRSDRDARRDPGADQSGCGRREHRA